MNRRQKIIVSVVGIFVVVLALIGITYGYFLTRIQGNTNTTSISVTTENLELVYGDGNQNIITKTNIMPDTVIGTKDFTVTNTGGDTGYVVLIDGDGDIDNGITPIKVTYVTSGTTRNGTPYSAGDETSFISNDFVYTLTCTIESSDTTRNGTKCNEVSTETTLPMNGGIILGNDIKSGDIHKYNLTVTYLDNDDDQTDDMNKRFNAQINIEDIRRINPYSDNTKSLAYNIINNSVSGKNGTTLKSEPVGELARSSSYPVEGLQAIESPWYYSDTSPVVQDEVMYGTEGKTCTSDMIGKYVVSFTTTNAWNVKIRGCQGDYPLVDGYVTENEKTISIAQDDLGTSYYYRGDVHDNYVNFAGMCWKIVRIEGDGSIKLILEDQYTTCDDNKTTPTTEVYTGNWNIVSGASANIGYDNFVINPNATEDWEKYSTIPNYLSSQKDYENSMSYKYLEWQKTLAKKLDSNITDSSTIAEIDAVLNSKLKSGNWCYNDGIPNSQTFNSDYKILTFTQEQLNQKYDTEYIYYDSWTRLGGNGKSYEYSTFKCPVKTLSKFDDNRDGVISSGESNMYIGALTADEVVYSGQTYDVNYWNGIISGYDGPSEGKNYLNNSGITNGFLTMSLDRYEPWLVGTYGKTGGGSGVNASYNSTGALRPVISVKAGVEISEGTGIQEDPYVIS